MKVPAVPPGSLDALLDHRVLALHVRRALPLVLAAAIVVASLAISPNFRWETPGERTPYAGDFLHEWVGGYIVRAGDRARLYDRAYANDLEHRSALLGFRLKSDGYLPMVYPPAYYLAVSPLSLLDYRPAAWVWVVLSLGAFVAALVLLARALRPGGSIDRAVPTPDPRWHRIRAIASLVALPAAVAFVPFAENLVSSQKGTIALLVFTLAFLDLQRGRPLAAGLVFGALAMKPQLALVVPLVLLAKGEWRFVLGAGITAAVLAAVSLAVGVGLTAAYLRILAGAADYIRFGGGYLDRLHGTYAFFTLLAGEPTPAARLATVVAAVGVVWLVARLFRGPLDVRSPRFLAQFSGLVLATIVLSPHVLTYDLTVLLLPLLLVGVLLLRGAIPEGRRRAVLWLVVGLYVACGVSSPIAHRTGVQVTTPLMVALLAVLAWPAEAPASLTEHLPARHTV